MGGVAAAVSVFVKLNQYSRILWRQCCLGRLQCETKRLGGEVGTSSASVDAANNANLPIQVSHVRLCICIWWFLYLYLYINKYFEPYQQEQDTRKDCASLFSLMSSFSSPVIAGLVCCCYQLSLISSVYYVVTHIVSPEPLLSPLIHFIVKF